MELVTLGVLAAAVIGFGLFSARLEGTPVTGPIVFLLVGLGFGAFEGGLADEGMLSGAVGVLAEATLVVLLYTDAIRIDIAALRRQWALPARLLLIGLPLTVAVGWLAGLALGFAAGGALLLAAILAPTDAAVGQAVIANQDVPVRIRQALNVESGLNDGLMLPVITIAVAVASAGESARSGAEWATFVLQQVGLGIVAGGLIGYVGGRLLDRAADRGTVEGGFRQLVTLAIGVAAFVAAGAVGGNGFVAVFVAGLGFGYAARGHCEGAYDFAEDEGQLLALITFMFFGAAVAGPALTRMSWQAIAYALISLTIVRMVPVAIASIGLHLRGPTVVYLGWFGPRGLASILFGLFLIEEAELAGAGPLIDVVALTIVLSVLLHGVTAAPAAERYAAWFRFRAPDVESVSVAPMPFR